MPGSSEEESFKFAGSVSSSRCSYFEYSLEAIHFDGLFEC